MPAKIKIRSVSVEDLGNIVKQMIDGVLEDNDQVAKLHQVVLKEYYFKKMEESKEAKAKIETADYILNQNAKRSQMDVLNSKVSHSQCSSEIADTQTRNIETLQTPPKCDVINDFLRNENLAKESDSPEMSAGELIDGTLENCDETAVMQSSKISSVLNSQKAIEQAASSFFVDKLDSPVVHHMRRPKYIKLVQEVEIHNSNIALRLATHNTTTNFTQTANDAISPTANSEEHIQSEKNTLSNVEVIEWRSRSLKKRASEPNPQLGKTREIPVQFKSKGEIAFENWKKEKTNTYHRIIREEERKKRLEQTARAKELEKKEAAHEAYLYWRRQQDARQKLVNKRKRIMAQMESQKLQSREKRTANYQAFKAWKRQKDFKLRERKMYMMAYGQQNNPQPQTKPQKPKPGVHVAFNMWLDQLDCVLHQKYLRERRYLVRSFYCQPAYFGTAALSAS